MAGKWHLGHRPLHMPRAHGFDSFFGLGKSHDYNPDADPDLTLTLTLTLSLALSLKP